MSTFRAKTFLPGQSDPIDQARRAVTRLWLDASAALSHHGPLTNGTHD
jgi:hypothetical protein